MTHRFSVLATFLLLAILHVCTAFRPPVGVFRLSLRDLALDVDGHNPGNRAVLVDEVDPLLWYFDPTGSIRDTRSGLYLGYEKTEVGAPLILTMKPVQWKIQQLERGFQIGLWENDLVFGALSLDIFPPDIGLTKQDKEESQEWILRPLDLDPTSFVPEGDYEIMMEGKPLGVETEQPFSPVLVLDHLTPFTIWRVENEGSSDTVSIKNLFTGFYLSYNLDELDEPLVVTADKSVFRLTKVDDDVQILTGSITRPPLAITKLPGSPTRVGLQEAEKGPDQKWTLRPMRRLYDSPRQYRLPFRRLRLW
ncbi:hypothetical protein DFQ26_001151 [Actinomortierella ambigua]|nr:hypothetical protein DFQ26_001151 [Actinomortierella ambigua]